MKLMKSFIGIGLLVMSVGCFVSVGRSNPVAQSNPQAQLEKLTLDTRVNILKLSSGMGKQEVIIIMGSESYSIGEAQINKPFRSSMYNKNGDMIEILFYYTELRQSDGKLTDDELTPLVFINGKLDSWGWEPWVEKAKRYDINVNYKLN